MAEEVSEWLSGINSKYAQYAAKLVEAGFDDVASCECLTEPDLKEMVSTAPHALQCSHGLLTGHPCWARPNDRASL